MRERIQRAKRQVAMWQAMFDAAIDPETIDYVCGRITEAEDNLNQLFIEAKTLQEIA